MLDVDVEEEQEQEERTLRTEAAVEPEPVVGSDGAVDDEAPPKPQLKHPCNQCNEHEDYAECDGQGSTMCSKYKDEDTCRICFLFWWLESFESPANCVPPTEQ